MTRWLIALFCIGIIIWAASSLFWDLFVVLRDHYAEHGSIPWIPLLLLISLVFVTGSIKSRIIENRYKRNHDKD